MALSDEQIEALNVRTLGHRQLARAIEAEVHKEYEALIRQMLEALETAGCYPPSSQQGITAARARLGTTPPPGPDVPKPEA